MVAVGIGPGSATGGTVRRYLQLTVFIPIKRIYRFKRSGLKGPGINSENARKKPFLVQLKFSAYAQERN